MKADHVCALPVYPTVLHSNSAGIDTLVSDPRVELG